MKPYTNITVCLCIVLGSCKPNVSSSEKVYYSPLQNGFGVIVQPMGIDTGPGAKLYYKGTNEKPVLVWPYIGTHGYPILFTNDIALLLADKPDERGYLGNGALIVVQGVGPAMDISEDVLKAAAEQNHVDFKRALKVCEPLRLNRDENGIKVFILAEKYKDRTIPDLEIKMTWQQIFEIMQDVRSTGRTNRVTNTDVPYLQKDYSN